MTPNYPKQVCFECGLEYGHHMSGNDTTCMEGECGLCGDVTTVTSPVAFGGLSAGWRDWWAVNHQEDK